MLKDLMESFSSCSEGDKREQTNIHVTTMGSFVSKINHFLLYLRIYPIDLFLYFYCFA
jgi:hypothetical protein